MLSWNTDGHPHHTMAQHGGNFFNHSIPKVLACFFLTESTFTISNRVSQKTKSAACLSAHLSSFLGFLLTDLGCSEKMCLCFLCSRFTKICLLVCRLFFFCFGGNKVIYVGIIICQDFYLVGKHDIFENVDMSTIEQIWHFSACGRPGTKFYVGSPLGGSKS